MLSGGWRVRLPLSQSIFGAFCQQYIQEFVTTMVSPHALMTALSLLGIQSENMTVVRLLVAALAYRG